MKERDKKPRPNFRRAPYREKSICSTVHAKNRERVNTNTPIEADLDDSEETRIGLMSDSSLRSSMLSAEDQASESGLDDWSPNK